jgi:hypothetical protein
MIVGFQILGLGMVRSFLPNPKQRTEPQRWNIWNLGTLEPCSPGPYTQPPQFAVMLQNWINI